MLNDHKNYKDNAFPLGAMYWINPNYTQQQIDEDVRKIRQNNFSFIRSIIWWEHLEEKEGVFDFTLHDMLYEAATKNEIKIAQSFGMYPPVWLKKELVKKGMLSTARYNCIDIPDFHTRFELYIKTVVGRYSKHPAQDMWIVWNELSKSPCTCKYTERKYKKWLEDKYGTIDNLKAAWRREKNIFSTPCPDSFDDVDTLELTAELLVERRNYPLVFDWLTFCEWNLAQNLKWICDKVKEIDKVHPTHTNAAGLLQNEVPAMCRDTWQVAELVDTVDASIHPCHHFQLVKDIKDFPAAFSYSVDMILSSVKEKKDVWISELQGGSNIQSGNIVFTPTGKEIKSWLLQSIAKGIKGILFWIWQPWRAGWEAGEFGLLNTVNGQPTERSKSAADVGRILGEHSDFLLNAKKLPAQVAILYSSPTQILAYREGKEITNYPVLAMLGCYKALWKNNIAVDFVTPEEINNGILSNYKLLYMPFTNVVSKELGENIKEFVFKGGSLWADGHCAFKDNYSFLHSQNPGAGLDEVFGCREANLMAGREAIQILIEGKGTATGHIFEQWLEPTSGKVTATFKNGQPAVVINNYGKGKAMFIGTYLSIGYHENKDKGAEHLIVDFAREVGVKPIVKFEGKFLSLEANRLIGEDSELIVVTNHSDKKASFVMKIAGDYSEIIDMADNKAIEFDSASNSITRIKYALPEYETAIYLGRKR